MTDHRPMVREEIVGPHTVMTEFYSRFGAEVDAFVDNAARAITVWENYQAGAVRRQQEQEDLVWSAAYLLYAINAAVISTRLLLSGYIVPSGNQARTSVEALAFGVLLPFKDTGAFAEWKKDRSLEYKALENLRRHAEKCGVNPDSAHTLCEQAKWFDKYSHPTRLTLATIIQPETGEWHIGAQFAEEHLEQYRKEMGNRVSLSELLLHTIAGVHANLIERGLQDRPSTGSNASQARRTV